MKTYTKKCSFVARSLFVMSVGMLTLAAEEDIFSLLINDLSNRLTAGDVVGTEALMPIADKSWKKQIHAYASSLVTESVAGRLKLSHIESHCDNDTAVILVSVIATAGRRTIPFYALHNHMWHLVPTPTVAYRSWYGVTDEQRQRLEGLSSWAKNRMVEIERERHGAANADVVAKWSFGEGNIADQTLKAGAVISQGQRISTSKKRPSRLVLVALRDSNIVLAPGTSITFQNQNQEDGTVQLVIQVHEGTIQAEINDLGPYAKVRVKGSTSDVIVTGTVFVVQVSHVGSPTDTNANSSAPLAKNADYTATVSGHVTVVAHNTEDDNGVQIFSRQGISVTEDGLGVIDQLLNRPQLTGTLYGNLDIRSQGLANSDQLASLGGSSGEKSWTQSTSVEPIASQDSSSSSHNNSSSSTSSSTASSYGASSSTSTSTQTSSSIDSASTNADTSHADTSRTTNNENSDSQAPDSPQKTEPGQTTTSGTPLAVTGNGPLSPNNLPTTGPANNFSENFGDNSNTQNSTQGLPIDGNPKGNIIEPPFTDTHFNQPPPTDFSHSDLVITLPDMTHGFDQFSGPNNPGFDLPPIGSPFGNTGAGQPPQTDFKIEIPPNVIGDIVGNIQQDNGSKPARLGGAPGLPQ